MTEVQTNICRRSSLPTPLTPSAHPASSTLTSFPEETTATEALSEEECLKILEDFPEVSMQQILKKVRVIFEEPFDFQEPKAEGIICLCPPAGCSTSQANDRAAAFHPPD